MAVIKVSDQEVTVDGVSLTGASRLNLTAIPDVTKVAYCVREISLAASSGGQSMWTTGNGGITTFTRGLIISDQDIFVERRNDDSGAAEFSLELIEANVPFWFGAKTGAGTTERLDGATLVDNTDFADVDRIECQNEGTTAAIVSLYLFT